MDKELLQEIDSRIKLCLEAENRLDDFNTMLQNKEISMLECHLLKNNILKNRPEDKVKEEICLYLEKLYDLKNKIKKEELNPLSLFRRIIQKFIYKKVQIHLNMNKINGLLRGDNK